MTYRATVIESEEGFAVGCPALPGCWSQGATRVEALQNIQEAIKEVLEVRLELESEQLRRDGVKFELMDLDVAVLAHA